MSKVTNFDSKNLKIILDDGSIHDLYPHEFWILCPNLTEYVPTDGQIYPLDFGLLMHNAKISHGLVLAQTDLLGGISMKTGKKGNTKAAEELLERIRLSKYPNLPSRIRCHYLNLDKTTAEKRAQDWGWHNKSLEKCYLVLSGGKYHFADVTIYESLTKDPTNIQLAEKYWLTFNPGNNMEIAKLEVLADSCLYFPDWETYQEINQKSLIYWNQTNSKNSS